VYDPSDPALREDPYPTYRRLRDEAPVFAAVDGGFHALSRYDDVVAVLADWQRFSSRPASESDTLLQLIGPGDLLNLDPPRHDELRRLIRGAFAVSAVARREARLRATAGAILDELCGRGGGDLAAELAWPVPVLAMLDVLGLPDADAPMVVGWVRRLDLPQRDEVLSTIRDMRAYLVAAVEDRGTQPSRGLLRDIAELRASGELREDEVAGLCLGLMLAGTATVASLIGNALLVLQGHPGERALLSAPDADVARAVEEILRFESPVQVLPRTARHAVVLHGERIAAGSTVLLLLGSANRDERRFERPDTLDLRRKARRSVAMGSGIHFCIGASLARLEARVVLQELFARVTGYEPAGAPVRIASADVRGLLHLPVTLVPRSP
jgi:cytochrome P450